MIFWHVTGKYTTVSEEDAISILMAEHTYTTLQTTGHSIVGIMTRLQAGQSRFDSRQR
jgi:hypothetical protein